MIRATSVIDDCINKLKIRGKHKEKRVKTRKKEHGGKHTRPKKWIGARRPAGPATTALLILVFLYRSLTALAVFVIVLYFCSLWAQITRLLRLFSIGQFELLKYCSDSTFVLSVAHYIYN